MQKKKTTPKEEQPVVAKEILEMARRAGSEPDRLHRGPSKCSVCGSEGSSTTAADDERLCWVCRRLKISAWRDTDIQMNAQE